MTPTGLEPVSSP